MRVIGSIIAVPFQVAIIYFVYTYSNSYLVGIYVAANLSLFMVALYPLYRRKLSGIFFTTTIIGVNSILYFIFPQYTWWFLGLSIFELMLEIALIATARLIDYVKYSKYNKEQAK